MNGFDKKRVARCIDFPINVHVHKGFMVSVASQWNSEDSNIYDLFFFLGFIGRKGYVRSSKLMLKVLFL